LSKVVDVVDPKRLLESTQDAPSPNLLVQNLLGVARTEAAPDGARRRAKRSVDGIFTPQPEADQGDAVTNAAAATSAAAKGSSAKPSATKASAGKGSGAKSNTTRAAPPSPQNMPPADRRPGVGSDPCAGCNPFGG
jgi:hypothetical protein